MTDPILERLKRERGLRDETIRRFGIETDRLAGAWKYPADGRSRLKDYTGRGPKYRWGGPIDGALPTGGLYGFGEVSPGAVTAYLVNGEPAVWTAHQLGLPAFCTFGEGLPLPTDLGERLTSRGLRELIIVPDRDETGRRSAAKRAAQLAPYIKVRVIELPEEVGEKGDLSDFYRLHGFNDEAARSALNGLVAAAAPVELPVAGFVSPPSPRGGGEFKLKLLTAPAIADMEFDAVDWLVDPLMPSEGITLIVGAAGVGKSWLALSLSLALSRGDDTWLGYKLSRGRVLYLDEENHLRLVRKRLLKLGELPEQLVFTIGEGIRVDRPDHRSELLRVIREVQPVLVVFDSARRFHGAEENSATEMAAISRALKQLRDEAGCAFLVLDHTRKSRDGDPANWVRGSGEKQAFADSILTVSRVADGQLRLEHTKSRWDEPAKAFEVRLEGTVHVSVTLVGTAVDAQRGRDLDALRETVLRHLGEPQTRDDLARAVQRDAREDGQKYSVRQVERVIDALAADGTLQFRPVRDGKPGRPKHEYYVPDAAE